MNITCERQVPEHSCLVRHMSVQGSLFFVTPFIHQKVLGIGSEIPAGVLKSELIKVVPGLIEATKIESPASFRLEFLDHTALNKIMKDGLRLDTSF